MKDIHAQANITAAFWNSKITCFSQNTPNHIKIDYDNYQNLKDIDRAIKS